MKRQEELIWILLKSNEPLTTTELAKKLNVSSRTIRSDLEKIETEVLANHLRLERKPHIGVWIEGAQDEKDALFLNMTGNHDVPEQYSKEYRRGCILIQILLGTNKVYIDRFADMFFVSRSTIEKDLVDINKWLANHNLQLSKKPNAGLYVIGSEEDIRNAVCKLANDFNEKNISIESMMETYLDVDTKNVEDIVRKWNDKYEMHLNEVNMNNLAFHATVMLVRIKKNRALEEANSKLDTSFITYKDEFNALISELSKYAHIKIPKEEMNYLLMHLFGMYLSNESFINNEFLSDLRKLAQDITDDFVKKSDAVMALDLNHNEQFKQSLILHLLPTVYRLKYGLNLYNPLLNEIKNNYAGSYSLASIINSSFENYLGVTASEDEIAYVAMHLSVVVEQSKEQIQIAIVCNMGVGVSRFLSMKLHENFPGVDFVHCAADDVEMIDASKYVLSTIKLKTNKQYVLINPLLKDVDIQRIRTLIYGNASVNKSNFSLQTIMINHEHTDKLSVLREMSQRLRLCGAVTPMFLDGVLKREAMGSTEIGNGIVLTHGLHETVKRTQIAFYKLDHSIVWNTQEVNLIVMLAVAKDDAKNIMQMDWLYKMLINDNIILQINKCKNEREIYEILINASKKN